MHRSLALALTSALLLLSCESDGPAPSPAWRFRVQDGALRTATGEVLRLRGINVSNQNKYRGDHLYPLTPQDLQVIRGSGLNSVRYLTLWEAVMPEGPGLLDATYLEGLGLALAQLDAAGLYVIVDMHQDLYGSPFSPGAPEWSCPEEIRAGYEPRSPWWMNYSSAQVNGCFDHFWASAELRAELRRAWEAVAAVACPLPNVVGFDLLNEPWAGSRLLDETFDPEVLWPFYVELMDAIEAVCPGRVYFVEPSLSESLGFADPLPIPSDRRDRVVFAPHFYPPAVHDPGTAGYDGDAAALEETLLARFGSYLDAGIPVWIGEWGGMVDNPGFGSYLEDLATILERHGVGSAIYEYSPVEGGFSLVDAAGVRKPVFDRWALAPVPTLLPDVPSSVVPDFDRAGITVTVRCVQGREIRLLWPLGEAYACVVEPPDALPDLRPARGFTSATCARTVPMTLDCRAN